MDEQVRCITYSCDLAIISTAADENQNVPLPLGANTL